MPVSPIGGYVLAGGRSTRMGRDKALLELAGLPLVQHAVRKLRRITADVHILSSQPELGAFAPLVPDLRDSCGPLGGIEAALSHTRHDWILVLPVDMPFLPTVMLERWSHSVVEHPRARVAFFTVDGLPQPALCILHREMSSSIANAVQQGRFRLDQALESAAAELSTRQAVPLDQVLLNQIFDRQALPENDPSVLWSGLPEAQRSAPRLWFANLNTPEEFAEAEACVDALDI